MQQTNPFLLVLLLISGIIFSGCQDDESDPGYDIPFAINFQSKFGLDDFNYNQEYMLNGRKITFSKAQIYLSGFNLKGDPNQMIYRTYLSVNPEKNELDVGFINEGQTNSLEFNVGIDSATNHSDPSVFTADSPLSPLNKDFEFWAWASGYRFIVLEGMLDTTAAMNGQADTYFEMHIGGDMFLSEVSFEKQADIISGGKLTYNIIVDYSRFLDGVDLQNDYITHTADNITLAQTVVGNIPNVFTIQ